MTKGIIIDGKPVKFRASAGIPRMYRMMFKRDVLVDMSALFENIQANGQITGANLSAEDLTTFENLAYTMAKHADPQGVPEDIMEWLDQFEVMSIYDVFPQILELWVDNEAVSAESKKKFAP